MPDPSVTLRVLHVVPSFYPATYFGGPIYSVFALCNALAARDDVELRVLTTDSAGPSRTQRLDVPESPIRYSPGYDVHYFRRQFGVAFAPSMFAAMPHLVRWADVIHLTAVYSPPTIPVLALSRALRKPIVWSPRGSFQKWQSSTHLRLKAAWNLISRALVAPSSTIVHATSEEEAATVDSCVPGLRVRVIPNGVNIPVHSSTREWMPNGVMRLLFLGRLHPIKGIENLLRAVTLVQRKAITLRICGTGDASYIESLRALTRVLGLLDRVQFTGAIAPDSKGMVFETTDLCIVPSFSESFGIVVAESLAHGVPVVASRGTPWSELQPRRCGLWVNNSPTSLATAISNLKREELATMGSRGRIWMKESFDWSTIAARMAALYRELATGN